MLRTLVGNWGEAEDQGVGMVRQRRIECKEEGAWVFVAEERVLDGVPRKVTSYGRSVRSFVRSVSSDVQFPEPILNNSNVIIEYPSESSHDLGQSSHDDGGVIITEVLDDEAVVPDVVNIPITVDGGPVKKTSVVTLGKGNIVLIDAEETNFRVSAKPEEKPLDSVDRKPKRVEFCKTEVHFAPEAGKFNIVETDEKPPPNQIFRRKKKPKDRPPRVNTSNLPKVYFGDDRKDLLAPKDVDKPLVFNGTSFGKEASQIGSETIIPIQKGWDEASDSSIYSGTNNRMGFFPSGKVHSEPVALLQKDINEQHSVKQNANCYSSKGSRPDTEETIYNGCSDTGKKINDIKSALGYTRPSKLRSEVETKVEQKNDSNRKNLSNGVFSSSSNFQSHAEENTVFPENHNFDINNYLSNRKNLSLNILPIKVPASDLRKTEDIQYLGNVSPKLKNLIENSECREFNFRRKKPSGGSKETVPSVLNPPTSSLGGKCRPDIIPVEKKIVERRGSVRSVSSGDNLVAKRKVAPKSKAPFVQSESKYRTSEKIYSSSRRECSRIKVAGGKQTANDAKNSTNVKEEDKMQMKVKQEKIKPPEVINEHPIKNVSPKTVVGETPPIWNPLRLRRSREPLKSFEKVSNGWVGHCVVPVKRESIYTSEGQNASNMKATIKLTTIENRQGTRSPESPRHSTVTKLSLTPDSWKVSSNNKSISHSESTNIKSSSIMGSSKAYKSNTKTTTKISLTPDSWKVTAKSPTMMVTKTGDRRVKESRVFESWSSPKPLDPTSKVSKDLRAAKSSESSRLSENQPDTWKAPSMTTTKLLGQQSAATNQSSECWGASNKSTVKISSSEGWNATTDIESGNNLTSLETSSSENWKAPTMTTMKLGSPQEIRPIPAVRKKLSTTPQSAPRTKISSPQESLKMKKIPADEEIKVVPKPFRNADSSRSKMPADRIDAHNSGIRKPGGDRVATGGSSQDGSLRRAGCCRHQPQAPSGLAKKQFSLSKEHLKSVSLVRETLLSRQRTAFSKAAAAAAAAAAASGGPRGARTRPLSRKKESPLGRLRRDSEQSDDSVLRADEEVRAYMYNENKR